MFLLTNLVLQGFLLYMLSVEERTLVTWTEERCVVEILIYMSKVKGSTKDINM